MYQHLKKLGTYNILVIFYKKKFMLKISFNVAVFGLKLNPIHLLCEYKNSYKFIIHFRFFVVIEINYF
jgi:hypothetical protein